MQLIIDDKLLALLTTGERRVSSSGTRGNDKRPWKGRTTHGVILVKHKTTIWRTRTGCVYVMETVDKSGREAAQHRNTRIFWDGHAAPQLQREFSTSTLQPSRKKFTFQPKPLLLHKSLNFGAMSMWERMATSHQKNSTIESQNVWEPRTRRVLVPQLSSQHCVTPERICSRGFCF